MMFAIKTAIADAVAETFDFAAQKTMYGGKGIAAGDVIYLFASENEGGAGLIARGLVTSAAAVREAVRRRAADAAREHHGAADCFGEASVGPD